MKLPVSAAYWKDAVTWSPSLAGKRSLLSVRSAALKASFSMKGVGQLACAPVPPLAMTVNSPGTATPFQPVKSPVAKLPFETTAPASRARLDPADPAGDHPVRRHPEAGLVADRRGVGRDLATEGRGDAADRGGDPGVGLDPGVVVASRGWRSPRRSSRSRSWSRPRSPR